MRGELIGCQARVTGNNRGAGSGCLPVNKATHALLLTHAAWPAQDAPPIRLCPSFQ